MKSLQVFGPFVTNYSLAKVNRSIGIALSKVQSEYRVSFYCDKDKIDKWPDEEDFKTHPEIKKLFSPEKKNTDVVLYNNFPKTLTSLHGLKELPGKTKLMYFAWEESIYPKLWVDEINQNIHGVVACSSFVKNVLRGSGVKVPIKVALNALDDDVKKKASAKYPLSTNKKFKFLHISTGKYRKGVDILIKAYFSTFTKDDDVCLVIKSSPGPDNTVDQIIAANKKDNSPEVININDPSLTDEEIRNLTAECDCAVYPSRAEGFGLPILEAMFHEVPVIVTNYSGHLDFCNDENSYLIDYKMVYAKESELVNVGAMWAEPDLEELKQKMREVYRAKTDSKKYKEEGRRMKDKIQNAKLVADSITWEKSAAEIIAFVKEIETVSDLKNKNCAVLTFIKNESGIAEYSEDLYSPIESSFAHFFYLGNKDVADRVGKDSENIVRTWVTGETSFEETLKFVKDKKIDIFHIQYHSGSYFPPESLDSLIVKLKQVNVEVIVTLHAVRGQAFDFIKDCKNLNKADKVVIHNKNDYQYASESLQNLYLMELPAFEFKGRDRIKLKKELGLGSYYPIVATHGLLNVNKSVPQIIDAVNSLKNEYPEILFLGLNAVSSNNILAQGLYQEIISKIKSLNMQKNSILIKDFLDDEYIEILMQCSDVNVFAYLDFAGESASAAIRRGLASLNPTITTDINMFQEFKKEVYKIEDNSPDRIANGIKDVIKNKSLATELVKNAKKYIEKNSYESKALETLEMYALMTTKKCG